MFLKNFNVNVEAGADANADVDAGGSAIALPGLRPDELISRILNRVCLI